MIYLRKAEEKDIPKLYEYLNKKYVEKNFSDIKKTEKDYITWYKEALGIEKYIFLIIEDENKNFIGHIRYEDFIDFFDVMIFIRENNRNKGFGKEALKKSFSFINKEIIARILDENIISKSIFEKTGFNFIGKDKEFNIYEKNIDINYYIC